MLLNKILKLLELLEVAFAEQWAGKTPAEFEADVKEFYATEKPLKFA